MKKKGQLETQFNWIFAAIAGALILSLISGFIFTQMRLAKEKDNEQNLKDFQGIISALKLTEERVESMDLDPRTSFSLDFESNVFIMGKSSAEITTDAVAAPRILTGRKLYIWTKPVMMPARITNIIFLSPSYRHYVFVANNINDPEVKEFYGLFPDSINKMLAAASGTEATVQNILKQPDAKIRIVYINMPVQNKAALAPKKISEIAINLNACLVSFNSKSYPLYCDANTNSIMPQIAVLVDNGDDYNVSVSRILNKAGNVYEILSQRASELRSIYQGDCRNIFDDAIPLFNALKNSKNMEQGVLLLNEEQLKTLYDRAESKGCANLY